MTYYTKVNNGKNCIGLSMSIVEVYGVVVKTQDHRFGASGFGYL